MNHQKRTVTLLVLIALFVGFPMTVSAQLRKIIKTRGHFPSDEAATKLLWLALRNITCKWGSATHDWKAAMNQFAILYEDRFTQPHH